MQEVIPVPLDYATPPRRQTRKKASVRITPINMWVATLLLYPIVAVVVVVCSPSRMTWYRDNSPTNAVEWVLPVIALRAVAALFAQDRTWWSLAYLGLYCLLPMIANAVAMWYWR